jgi:hypothetical protein
VANREADEERQRLGDLLAELHAAGRLDPEVGVKLAAAIGAALGRLDAALELARGPCRLEMGWWLGHAPRRGQA